MKRAYLLFTALLLTIAAYAINPVTEYSGYGKVFYKGKHWLFGGGKKWDVFNHIWSSTDGVNWAKVGNAPWSSRDDMTCVVFKGKIYIIGGGVRGGASSPAFNDIWVSTNGTNWKKIGNISGNITGLKGIKSFIYKDKLFLYEGLQDNTGKKHPYIFYTEDGTTWKQKKWDYEFIERDNKGSMFEYKGKLWSIKSGEYNPVYKLEKHTTKQHIYYTSDGLNWHRYGNCIPDDFLIDNDASTYISNDTVYRKRGNVSSTTKQPLTRRPPFVLNPTLGKFYYSNIAFNPVNDTVISDKTSDMFIKTIKFKYSGAVSKSNIKVKSNNTDISVPVLVNVTSSADIHTANVAVVPTTRRGKSDISLIFNNGTDKDSIRFEMLVTDNPDLFFYPTKLKQYNFKLNSSIVRFLPKDVFSKKSLAFNPPFDVEVKSSNNKQVASRTETIAGYGKNVSLEIQKNIEGYSVVDYKLQSNGLTTIYREYYTVGNPGDVAPVFENDIDDKTVNVGDDLELNIFAHDINSDKITFTAKTKPDWLTIYDNRNGSATIEGTAPKIGDYKVVVNASDGALSTEKSFTIHVRDGASATGTKIIAITGNMSFGNVAVGASETKELTIANSGTADLTVTNINVPSGYSVSETSFNVTAGSSYKVNVIFSPTTSGVISGDLVVVSDKTSRDNTISLSGGAASTKIMAISGVANFGNVEVGKNKTTTFTLSNNGNQPLTVTGVNLIEGFTISEKNFVIQPGKSKSVNIVFTPVKAKDYSGDITFLSDKTSGGNIVRVTASGVIANAVGYNSVDKIKVYPNPVSSILYISSLTDYSEIKVLGMNGNLIRVFNRADKIDFTDFANGMYIVLIKHNNNVSRFVIVKH
ncbi:MAG: choice-of-anchor D domain-containing protein [Bacteroidales bacterium]|jgi:hypothetical protein|nr:choice-of-anchor D domain-containing protein [Bacteroidales bacterium]